MSSCRTQRKCIWQPPSLQVVPLEKMREVMLILSALYLSETDLKKKKKLKFYYFSTCKNMGYSNQTMMYNGINTPGEDLQETFKLYHCRHCTVLFLFFENHTFQFPGLSFFFFFCTFCLSELKCTESKHDRLLIFSDDRTCRISDCFFLVAPLHILHLTEDLKPHQTPQLL